MARPRLQPLIRRLRGAEPESPRAASDPATKPAKAKKPLVRAQLELLERMRADNRAAPAPFRATDYWVHVNERFDEWFAEEGIRDLEKQGYNALFSSPDRRSGKYYTYAVELLYRQVRERDRHGLLDRVRAEGSKSVVTLGEHQVSWDLLLSVSTLLSLGEIEPRVFDEPVVVADLGAGWGRIGHALAMVNPQASYLLFDLPEALLVASTFLPRMLPEGIEVFDYARTREVKRFTREILVGQPGVRFCATQDLERVDNGAIDLLANVASFQEMTRDQVNTYLSIVDRIAAGVVLEERWRSPRGLEGGVIAGYDEYAFPERWERRFLRSSVFSDAFFEAGFTVRGDRP